MTQHLMPSFPLCLFTSFLPSFLPTLLPSYPRHSLTFIIIHSSSPPPSPPPLPSCVRCAHWATRLSLSYLQMSSPRTQTSRVSSLRSILCLSHWSFVCAQVSLTHTLSLFMLYCVLSWNFPLPSFRPRLLFYPLTLPLCSPNYHLHSHPPSLFPNLLLSLPLSLAPVRLLSMLLSLPRPLYSLHLHPITCRTSVYTPSNPHILTRTTLHCLPVQTSMTL